MLKRPHILLGLLILVFFGGLLLSRKHPLLIKTLTGQANFIGKPIYAKVFTNGNLNKTIRVYEYDDYILLYREGFKESKEIVCLNPKAQLVGTPVSNGEGDYKIYYDNLIQSECGGLFIRFNDGAKRTKSFDPDLRIMGREITFKMSPEVKDFNCDSIRIIK